VSGDDRSGWSALLVGTSTSSSGLVDLPAVSHNLADLKKVLASPDLVGMDENQIRVVKDPSHPREVLEPLTNLVDLPLDVLLVYFAGHGLIDEGDGNLHLAITGSSLTNLAWEAVKAADIRRLLSRALARTRIWIVDSCFSGRAVVLGPPEVVIAGAMDVSGAVTIASAPENSTALSPPGERHTAFTGALLEEISAGDREARTEYLTVEALVKCVRRNLARREMPQPKVLNVDDAQHLRFTRNAAFVSTAAPPKSQVLGPALEHPQTHRFRPKGQGDEASVAAEAETWYRQAAKGGKPNAMFNLGLLLNVRGDEASVAEAETWYRLAAKAGSTDAMNSLGRLLSRRGDEASVAEAETWYRLAAKAGSTDAMNVLGRLLQYRGDATSVAEAEVWYRRAATAGNSNAMFNLGLLLNARDDEASVAEAEIWYRQAAIAGSTEAMTTPSVHFDQVEGRDISIQVGQGAARSKPWWPVVVGSVPPRANCFQNRAVALKKLVGAGAPGRTADLVQPARVVSGLPGVGKTQLAAAYARQMLDTKMVDLLVWVPAATRAGIVARFAQAAEGVGLSLGDGLEAASERFVSWLASTDRRWLIVLDDLTAADDVRGLWPPDDRPAGQTVVTTRRRDATLVSGRDLVDLDVFSAEEAHAFLTEWLPTELADDADGVAADLGRLPLALAHAAAFMVDRDLSCSGYRARFADRRRRLGELFPDHEAVFDDAAAATVATTWSMSIDQANQLRPVGLAGSMLELASMLDPDGIPVSLFRSHAALSFLTARVDRQVTARDGALDQDAVDGALANLRRFSLISVTGSVVRVQALLQRAVRDSLSETELDATIRAGASGLLEVWPDIERDTSLAALLRANTAVLADRAESDALWITAGAPRLFLRAVSSLGEAGLVADATVAAAQLHQQADSRLGPDHPDTLNARHSQAKLRARAGDVAGAVSAFEELLADRLRVLGPDHPDTLATRHSLAYWRGEAGDLVGAVSAFEELLADRLRVLGPDHPDTLATRHSLAWLQVRAGDLAGAVSAFEELLADRLRVLGPDHPDTLATRANLARLQVRAGDPAGAEAAFEELLADRLRVLGPDHPDTLATRNNVAYSRGAAGDPAGAAAAFEELLADRLRVLGPDHPDTLAARNNVAYWRGEAGDPVGAAAAFEQLLADRLRVLGPDHPDTLTTRANLAHWRGEAGDPVGAAAAFEQLLADRLRVLGPDHPDTLTTRASLALWRGEAGDPVGAEAAFEQLLADRMRVLGPDHPDTLTTRASLAYWRGEAGDPAGAEAAFEQLLADRMRVLGPDHPDILPTRNNVAYWHGEAKNSVDRWDSTKDGLFMLGEWSPVRELVPARLRTKSVVMEERPPQLYVDQHAFAAAVAERTDDTGEIAYMVNFKIDHRESFSTQLCHVTLADSDYAEVRAIEAMRQQSPGLLAAADSALAKNAHDYVLGAVPSSVAINVVVVSQDGELLCAKRSAAVVNGIGLWTVGIFETLKRVDPSRPGQPEDFFLVGQRALLEELGLSSRDVEDLQVTWLGIYRPLLRGHVVATVRLKITKDKLLERATRADSSYEHEKFGWIPLNRATLTAFLAARTWDGPEGVGLIIHLKMRDWIEQSRLAVYEAWRFHVNVT